MANKIDTDDLYDLLQMIKGDEDAEKTSLLLMNNVDEHEIFDSGNMLFLKFKNGKSAYVEYRNDSYHLVLSDFEDYVLDDDCMTKMSSDRVTWYLRKVILDTKFPMDD